MNPPDLQKILEQAREMQTKLAEVQRELSQRRVEASSGGGMVTAVATGDLRIAELRIEPGLLSDPDAGMLQDLVVAAINAALAEAQRTVSEELARVAGPGIALPGMPGPG